MTHKDQTTHRWTVRMDRREGRFEAVCSEMRLLEATLEGLSLEMISPKEFEDAPDEGAFRDFHPIAYASAPDDRILEAMAEELLLEFGFLVDFLKNQDAPT